MKFPIEYNDIYERFKIPDRRNLSMTKNIRINLFSPLRWRSCLPLNHVKNGLRKLNEFTTKPENVAPRVRKKFLNRIPDIEPSFSGIKKFIESVQVEFLGTLDKEMGDISEKKAGSRWRMCGPASLALAWILALKTGLPIGKGIKGDHIEVCLCMYVPDGRPQDVEEETYIKLHIGNKCAYIDPIYGSLMKAKVRIILGITDKKDFEPMLAREFSLRPFDAKNPNLRNSNTFKGLDAGTIGKFHELCVLIWNTEEGLREFPRYDLNGRRITAHSAKNVRRIIKHFVPDWDDKPLLTSF